MQKEVRWHARQVAVLGAGVMGAKIAAMFVNAGFSVSLFDLPAGDNKNMLAEDAIRGLLNTHPPALVDAQWSRFIKPANYETDLATLTQCDLIIEAIAERLDWKEELFNKIESYISEHAVLATNTSGLSIETLSSVLPASLQSRFMGLHFFNPPRYLSLVEMIPSTHTDRQLMDQVETFLTIYLGKNVIRAFDTPNFIGNRLGVFALLSALHHAEAFDLRFDVVDALTGKLIGHPKSATLRTLDIVGLDTFSHVVNTIAKDLKDDPWHKLFRLPDWMKKLIDKGALGEKAGAGIYKKVNGELFVYDVKEGNYKKMTGQPNRVVVDILKDKDRGKAFQRLFDDEHSEAQFLWACHRDVWQYASYHLKEIANNVRDLDCAMKWGYAWEYGPFELWQTIGIDFITKKILAEKGKLPDWISSVDKRGFYDQGLAFSAQSHSYVPPSSLPVYERQRFSQHLLPVFENEYVEMFRTNENVFVLSFKSKLATISQGVLGGIQECIQLADRSACGLVIWQRQSPCFSVGADIKEFLETMRSKRFTQLEQTLKTFQDMCLSLRYARIPVVAALKGYVFGGGCELAMHCDLRVAHLETQMGLVEAGIGLLPGGGGTKEWALRASDYCPKNPMLLLQQAFEMLAHGKSSLNAWHAKSMGYLLPNDPIIMNANELLYVAVQQVKALSDSGYCPPRAPRIRVVGEAGWAQFEAQLVNLFEGKFISAHDYSVAHHIATVLSGGMIDAGNEVDEAWLLRLEREGFVELAKTSETQLRIAHIL